MPHAPLQILIVDDEEIVGLTLELFVESLGHTPKWVPNAADGCRQIQESTVDLLILDIRLPGSFTSYDLIGWIQQNQPDIPIIIISGHGDQEECQTAFDQGAQAFLGKPFSIDDLSEKITALTTTS